MNPPLKEQLKEWKQQYRKVTGYGKKKKRRQKSQMANSERLTESDIKSLMGVNKRGLRRGKGGAWK